MARKAKYSAGRSKTVLCGTPLTPNAAIAVRYDKRLQKLIKSMVEETDSEIRSLYKTEPAIEHFAQDDTIGAQAKILMNALQKKFEKLFAVNAKPMAEAMIDENGDASAAALKSSLRELSEGLTLKTDIFTGELNDVITASVAENVALIKSIPQQYFSGVQGAVMRSITTGNGLADLIPALQKYKNITKGRAKLIATDQTRKAFSNINRIRAQKLGIKKYQWLHSSGGKEPRPLHKNVLNRKIFDMDNPPVIDDKTGERGYPGQLINCFVGETKVFSKSGVIRIYRSPFNGQIVDVFAGSDFLSTTPNHPIFTDRGWIPAGEIRKGDNLVKPISQAKLIVESNNDETNITFDELFLAFSAHVKCAAGSKFDFYGDIPDGDVETITFAHPLSFHDISDILKSRSDFLFSETDGGTLNIKRISDNPHIFEASEPCIKNKGISFGRGELAHANNIGITPISFSDSVAYKDSGDDLTGNGKSTTKGQFAFSTGIEREDFAFGQIGNFSGGRTSLTGNDDAHISQMETEIVGMTPDSMRSFFQSCSSRYEFTCVNDSVLRDFSGHVYTLETVLGWYNVTPARFVVKNCRCRLIPVISFGEE